MACKYKIDSGIESYLRSDNLPDQIEQMMNNVSIRHNSLEDISLTVNAGVNDHHVNEWVAGLEQLSQLLKKQNLMFDLTRFSEDDDFLTILTNRSVGTTWENRLREALVFIKDCGLSRLAGDCRLIEAIYFQEGKHPAIMFTNKSKTEYVYYDEDKNRVIETNATAMARRLAENLQRNYINESKYFTNMDTGKFLRIGFGHPFLPKTDESEIHLWNAHLQALNDDKYQMKILKSLNIKVEPITGKSPSSLVYSFPDAECRKGSYD